MSRASRSAVAIVAALTILATACADADPGPSGAPSASEAPSSSRGPSTSGEATEPSAVATPAPTSVAGGVRPTGFGLVAATATAADGSVCELCVWTAPSPAQRGRGLMGVTDLGGADGMVFLYDTPSTSRFYMFNTPMPLSIAFFAPDGTFVSAADMEPCLAAAPIDCPRYPADDRFTIALEVPAGDLAEHGIGPGTRIELGDPVDSCG